jgi:hypothetical protein
MPSPFVGLCVMGCNRLKSLGIESAPSRLCVMLPEALKP